MKSLRIAIDLLRRALDAANKGGDFTFVTLATSWLCLVRLIAGDPLSDVQREVELGRAVAQRWGIGGDLILMPLLALVRTLRGLTLKFGCFDSEEIDESSFERLLASSPYLRAHACLYWIGKMQARYFAGDSAGALEASLKAQPLLQVLTGYIDVAEYHFFTALSRAACCDSVTADERGQHMEALAAHHRRLDIWADHCPENFENRAALVGAEIARIEGRDLDAMRLYERAIHSSRTSGFVHNEALAYERASAFYRARGFEDFAHTYLGSARACYAAWGADGKVWQLDQLHPGLKPAQPPSGLTSTITAPVEGLDLATLIQVSQAISGEIVLERLLDTVMRKAMEHAGAERAILIAPRGEELEVEAEARAGPDGGIVNLRAASGASRPEALLRYVVRTRDSVILDDALGGNPFFADPYFVENRVRSVLCLPLMTQAKLSGVLYLENNLAPGIFTSGRIAVLRVLASQAAISLENTRLYRDLEDREAKIRRLVDANIVGIIVADLDGMIVEANDAFLRIVGYDRDDLVLGRMSWSDLTPPEWAASDLRALTQLDATGTAQVYEKEYFRKDGSRVPVLIGAALFKEGGTQGVAFVLDLTERKRAQDALNQAGAELARVSRVTALSALTASIAHEVNQPLAGIITNAGTCLHMLDSTPANISGARETARRVLRDGNRASDVIKRLRALYSKREFTREPLDLNEAAQEVIALLSNEFQRIGLESQLSDALPAVSGDRIQLQQVILNLLRNAVEAMADVEDRPRRLLIKTEREEGGNVRLTVQDSGVGLSAQTLESLFDAFRTTKSGGMGIGLFVCRSIIERHGGRLWAQPNQGTDGATFSFSIPCDAVLPLGAHHTELAP
jgi:PAS domain S-box-containing protein